ncbi:hypothetical protein NL676_013542 [Syzygium grande]|nr:hypothetical protein NL676_013542 [Syzygium grande]
MKLLAMRQSHADSQSGPALRGGLSRWTPPSRRATVFWLAVHAICCLGSLVLGFRFSRLLVFLLFSTSPMFHATTKMTADDPIVLLSNPSQAPVNESTLPVAVGGMGSRSGRGPTRTPSRHEGAPDHRESDVSDGTDALLMLVPYKVVWIVVEASGVSSETASLIRRPGLRTIHVGFEQEMPEAWEDRHSLEAKMRVHALRIVREKNLDGIVMFADDSNIHSMELFDEIQTVKWIGAVSLGILPHSTVDDSDQAVSKIMNESNSLIAVQGPVCDSANQFIGWRTDNRSPNMHREATHVDDRGSLLPGKLEWAGFALNSRMLWKDAEDKPEWETAATGLWFGGFMSKPILVANSPKGWLIDPPLGITLPSKRTPWPDAPPELPFMENASSDEEEIDRHPTENQRHKRSFRIKRRHETETVEPQLLRREPVEI